MLRICLALLCLSCLSCKSSSQASSGEESPVEAVENFEQFDGNKIEKSNALWKKELSANAYYILREKGTERSGTGALLNEKRAGIYACAACALPLFDASTKFESGSGWPSFYRIIAGSNVAEKADNSHGMQRVEVLCSRCDGHLGHVFKDGPQPTGLRYCINSAALTFKPK